MTIQFLVTAGMGKLEEGDDFNLQKALLMKMEGARQKIKINRTLRHVLFCLEVAVIVDIIIALCIVFRL